MKEEGKERAVAQGGEQIGRRGLGAVWGCKELGEKMEERAQGGGGGGTYGMLVLGLPRRWPPACQAQEKTARRGAMAAYWHPGAEEELRGPGRCGRWRETA